ncbi:hypothetical protein [Arthrobacter oryzae]|jgi:hypothetical protein|uniref:hypothetical protein n=1 Tax=Arthrobacter oryzae TaxID=409290 RepID=UPI00277EC25D|nr:hypothetical protein [Arthrobacter oryzae]MDQ0076143.1 hypothetical protein [Arthrobacter oryzae]
MTEIPDENGTARGDDGTSRPVDEAARDSVDSDLAATIEPDIAGMDDTPEGHPGSSEHR